MAPSTSSKTCTQCGQWYTILSQHVRQHPECCPRQLVVPPPRVVVKRPFTLAPLLATESLRSTALWELGGMRLERNFSDGDVQAVKRAAGYWQEASNDIATQSLLKAGLLAPGADIAEVSRVMQTDLFNGIRSDKNEKQARHIEYPPLVPRVTDLSGGDGSDSNHVVVSFSPLDMVEQRLQQCPDFRKAFLAESDILKSGDGYRTLPPDILSGYKDGVGARYHPQLMRPATPDEVNDVRGALEFNADDVEVRAPVKVPAYCARC